MEFGERMQYLKKEAKIIKGVFFLDLLKQTNECNWLLVETTLKRSKSCRDKDPGVETQRKLRPEGRGEFSNCCGISTFFTWIFLCCNFMASLAIFACMHFIWARRQNAENCTHNRRQEEERFEFLFLKNSFRYRKVLHE